MAMSARWRSMATPQWASTDYSAWSAERHVCTRVLSHRAAWVRYRMEVLWMNNELRNYEQNETCFPIHAQWLDSQLQWIFLSNAVRIMQWQHEELLVLIYLFLVRRGSSVGIATRYGLDGPGDRIPVAARFSVPAQTGPGAHPASCTMGTRSFLGVKRLGRGVDHPPQSRAEVKERVEVYFYSPSWPSWLVIGWALPFPFIHLSICLSVRLSVYLSVCLFICLSIYLSVHLSTYLI